MPKLEDVIDVKVKEACVELFQAYDHKISFSSKKTVLGGDLSGWAGMIGFYGHKLRGTLTLLLKDDVLKATGPSHDMSDWVAELSNQLLGRIKRKLRSYEVELWASTPLAISGDHLQLKFKTRRTLQYEFSLVGADVDVKIIIFVDALVDECVEAKNQSLADEENVSEGNVVFFD